MLVAVNYGNLIGCPLDEKDNVGVLNSVSVLTQESDKSIMVQHETKQGTTCLGESTRKNTR